MVGGGKTSAVLAVFFCVSVSVAEDIIGITRDYLGDIFTLDGVACNKTACENGGRQAAEILGEPCHCQCAPSHYTFRDDIKQCVKEFEECQMAMFVRPYRIEKIPLIFLPSQGEFVFPGAHIAASGTITLTSSKFLSCDVIGSEYMAKEGWMPIEGSEGQDVFGVSYEGNKTFLKWLGNDEDRVFLQHRLVLIRLMCVSELTSETFQPCAGLRIGWTRAIPHAVHSESSKKNSFIIVGLCLGILGLTYVLAFFIYLKLRRKPSRKKVPENSNNHRRKGEIESSEQNQVPTSTRHLKHQYAARENALPAQQRRNREDSELPTEGVVANESKTSSHPARRFISRMQGMLQGAKQRITNIRYRTKLVTQSEDNIEAPPSKSEDVMKSNKTAKGEVKYISRIESVYSIPVDAIPERQYTYPYDSNHPTQYEGSKFDLFRRDLYEKIRQIHENETNQSKITKEYPSNTPHYYRVRNLNIGYSSIPEEGKRNCSSGGRHFEETLLSEELKEEKLTEKEAQKNGFIGRNNRNRLSQIEKECLSFREIPEYHESHKHSMQTEECLDDGSRRGGKVRLVDSALHEEVTVISEEQSGSMDESDCKGKKSSEASASTGDDESIDADQYLQLSSQVAQKLSTLPVPDLNCHLDEQQPNSLGQFWKDVRETFDRFKDKFESKSPPDRASAASSNDNWMLKRTEVPTNRLGKLVRKISFTRHDKFKKFRSAKIKETCDSLSKKSAISEINETLINTESQHLPCGDHEENQTVIVLDDKQTENVEETREATDNTAQQPEDVAESSVTHDGSYKEEDSTAPVGEQAAKDQVEDVESSTTCEVSIPSSSSGDESDCSTIQSEATSIKSSNAVTTETTETQSHRRSFDSDTLSMAYSDMTEDSLNTFGYASGTELLTNDPANHVDVCVSQLAETVLDSNGKILRGGRATKGFDIVQYFKSAGWEHVCHERGKNSPFSATNATSLPSEQRPHSRDGSHSSTATAINTHRRSYERKPGNYDERRSDGSSGGRCSKIKRRRVSPRRKRRESANACKHHSRKKEGSKRMDPSTSRNGCCSKRISTDVTKHRTKYM